MQEMINTLKKKFYRWLLTKTRDSIECRHIWKSYCSSMKLVDTREEHGYKSTEYLYCELCGESTKRFNEDLRQRDKYQIKLWDAHKNFIDRMKK